jgi:hypothetical protein
LPTIAELSAAEIGTEEKSGRSIIGQSIADMSFLNIGRYLRKELVIYYNFFSPDCQVINEENKKLPKTLEKSREI